MGRVREAVRARRDAAGGGGRPGAFGKPGADIHDAQRGARLHRDVRGDLESVRGPLGTVHPDHDRERGAGVGGAPLRRITTGQNARAATAIETEPRQVAEKSPRPRVPSTIRSVRRDSSTSICAGLP